MLPHSDISGCRQHLCTWPSLSLWFIGWKTQLSWFGWFTCLCCSSITNVLTLFFLNMIFVYVAGAKVSLRWLVQAKKYITKISDQFMTLDLWTVLEKLATAFVHNGFLLMNIQCNIYIYILFLSLSLSLSLSHTFSMCLWSLCTWTLTFEIG